MEAVLEKIKEFADKAHGDQQRKFSPERYIAHPVRVMELTRKHGSTLPMQAAALLHDVLEDTEVSSKELKDFLVTTMNEQDAGVTLKLVMELTDIYTKANYPRLNRKERKQKESERLAETSAESQTIKYADIIDNCRNIAGQDADFAPLFLKECRRLLDRLTKGDKALLEEAREVIAAELSQLKNA